MELVGWSSIIEGECDKLSVLEITLRYRATLYREYGTMKRRGWGLVLLVGWLAIGLAVDFAGAEGEKPVSRASNARLQGGTSARHVRMLESLKKLVDERMSLSEEQKEKIDALFAEQIEDVQKTAAKWEKSRAENAEKIAKLRADQAKARQERDMERLRELQTQLRELMGPNTGLRMSQSQFDERVTAELNRKQTDLYQQLAREARMKQAISPAVKARGLKYFHLASKLDLTKEQWATFRELFRDHRGLWEGANVGDEALTKSEAKLRSGVLDSLTKNQRERFLMLEKKLDAGESIETTKTKETLFRKQK